MRKHDYARLRKELICNLRTSRSTLYSLFQGKIRLRQQDKVRLIRRGGFVRITDRYEEVARHKGIAQVQDVNLNIDLVIGREYRKHAEFCTAVQVLRSLFGINSTQLSCAIPFICSRY